MVAAAVGVAGTALTTRVIASRAQAAQARRLERAAERVGFAITERARLPAEALQTVGAFVAHAPVIDHATFDAVAASVVRRTPRIYAIEWAPLVPDAERGAVEARARADGHADWAIREAAPNGMVTAAPRPSYLPILHAYPENPAAGFDVLSRPEAAAVFKQACNTGQAVFSPRYRLIEDTDDIASVILYVPVWHGGRAPEDPAARCPTVAGAAILIFRVNDMLGETLDRVDRGDLAIAVFDGAGGPLLYERRPGSAAAAGRGARRDVDLPLYGRTWRVRVGLAAVAAWPTAPLAIGGGLTAIAVIAACAVAWVLANRRRLRALTRLGQYRVDGEIGRGSMGVVYRAQHLLLGRPAALKLLAGNLVDAGSRARFEREVRLAAKLQHPSIVAVYDFGVTAEGLFFYAMELLDGVTVRELVADGPVPVARAAAFVRQIAEALREAHDKQIVHRDLAPANLMITVRGNQHDVVKILDFGLVKRIRTVAGDPDAEEPQSETGVIIGTPGFIAPEVLRGRAADERVDIYALGCIWYGLLAGQFPYRGATPDATIRAQLQAAPVPLRKLAPEVPIALAELITECMQPDPRLRLRSMREVLQRLDALGLPAWTAEDARKAWKALRPAPTAG